VSTAAADPDPPIRGAEFVQSLERGLAVIRAFDRDDRSLTLSDVARKTGLTRAAARRFLHTLVELGYVRSDGRLFSLRPLVLQLGYAYLSGQPLADVAMPHLRDFVARQHQSMSVSVLDGDDVVYIARAAAKRIMTVQITIGTRFPAHQTSMGRVLLAHADPAWLDDYLARVELTPTTPLSLTTVEDLVAVLEQVRADGYALVDQELEVGLRSVAVPIHDASGTVVASVNTPMQATHEDPRQRVADLLPALRATADAIEADLKLSV
jgi:IclR family pca regulon transcriptional regulator